MDPLRLVGTWGFRREVHDHRDGAEYTAQGSATFTLEDDGRVRWAEHGTLSWAAGTTPVTRTLFLVRDEPPVHTAHTIRRGADGVPQAGWSVTFEDGRDFHPWTVGAVEHLCGLDLYQGGVDVPTGPTPAEVRSPAPSWELTWRVTGPEKDYTMHTRYSSP